MPRVKQVVTENAVSKNAPETSDPNLVESVGCSETPRTLGASVTADVPAEGKVVSATVFVPSFPPSMGLS